MPDDSLVQLTKRKGMLIFFERAPHSGLIKRLSVAVGKTRLAGWLDAGLDYTKQFNIPDDGIRGCLYKQYSGMCEQLLLLLLQNSRKSFGAEIKQCREEWLQEYPQNHLNDATGALLIALADIGIAIAAAVLTLRK